MSIVSGGKTQIAANLSAIPTGDNIAAYLTDAAGALLTSTLLGGKQRLDVTLASEFAEDSAHVSGDYGTQILAVRNDAGTALAADGDYIPFTTDSSGRLRVAADIDVVNGFEKVEDAAHASGDIGAFMLAVRNDSNTVLTSADGDYSPLAVDSAGRLKIVASGVFAEDAAHTTADLGQFILSVRRDTVGSNTSANGDYAEIQTNAVGKLRTVANSDSTILQQVVTVGTTAVALPTTALANRESIMIQNIGTNSRDIYIGSATVTSSGATRGILIGKGGFVTLDAGPNLAVYGIASGAGGEAAVLQMA
jgi:hypothetical protein